MSAIGRKEIPGYFSALISCIVLSVLCWALPTLNKKMQPIILALNSIPPLIPNLIVLLPTFHLSSKAVIVNGSIWSVLTEQLMG